MNFLYILEQCRVPVLNEFMLLITQLGEETAFLAIALVIFWCVDKRRGYFLLSVGFIGSMVNNLLKMTFRIPRPWVLDPDFTILEQARETATGYSFPSGHSQSAVGTFGALAVTSQNRKLRILCIICAVLVPLSRMYIGVHTPADVLVASAYSLGLVYLLQPIAEKRGEVHFKWLVPGMLLLAIGSLVYFNSLLQLNSINPDNFESAIKNAYTMIGCITGIGMVYIADKKWLAFSTEGIWFVQILKVILGLALVLLVKETLRSPLELVFSKYIARSVRYFLVVIVAGIFWPLTFPWFQKLGANYELRHH